MNSLRFKSAWQKWTSFSGRGLRAGGVMLPAGANDHGGADEFPAIDAAAHEESLNISPSQSALASRETFHVSSLAMIISRRSGPMIRIQAMNPAGPVPFSALIAMVFL